MILNGCAAWHDPVMRTGRTVTIQDVHRLPLSLVNSGHPVHGSKIKSFEQVTFSRLLVRVLPAPRVTGSIMPGSLFVYMPALANHGFVRIHSESGDCDAIY